MRTLALPTWRKPSLLVRRQACQRPNPHVNTGKPLGLVGFPVLLTERNSDVPPLVRSPDPIGFTLYVDAGIRHCLARRRRPATNGLRHSLVPVLLSVRIIIFILRIGQE